VKDRGKMIEGIAKNTEIKRADEMAETGYLAYRIKKKNNIQHLSSLSQDTLRNLIIKIEGKKDVDQKLKRLVKLLPTIDKY
jgi:ribosomal protein S6